MTRTTNARIAGFTYLSLPKILCSLSQISFPPTEPQTSSSLRTCLNLVNQIRRSRSCKGAQFGHGFQSAKDRHRTASCRFGLFQAARRS